MNTAGQSILAIDIGSSSVKAACIGTDGSIVVSCKVALPSIVNGDRVEIGAQPLWKAFVDSVGLLRQNGHDLSGCIGMGITTQMAGLVLLDREGQRCATLFSGSIRGELTTFRSLASDCRVPTSIRRQAALYPGFILPRSCYACRLRSRTY